jgi:hypothetical protein
MADQTTITADLVAEIWRTLKDMRDEAVSLGRDGLAERLTLLLQRMQAEGMADHLPTIEEIAGMWANG